MAEGWRIVRATHRADAFTGDGARLFGGRWNSRGSPLIYTSEHLSTAVLETYVHLRPITPHEEFLAFALTIPEALIERVPADSLPVNWRLSPAGRPTMRIGDAWVKERRSAVLQIPSVIIPEESNFLLNPAHPGFASIGIQDPKPFVFDPRLAAP